MAYPMVTLLPTAPSRTGDPEGFPNESSLFLARLTPWSSEQNTLAAYLNGLVVDTFNWGSVEGVTMFPARERVLTRFIAPSESMPGQDFAEKTDVANQGLFDVTPEVNESAGYLDYLAIYSDPLPGFVADPDRPQVNTLPPAMSRGDPLLTFNAKFNGFYGALNGWAVSHSDMVDFYHVALIEPEDYGSVADPTVAILDFGSI